MSCLLGIKWSEEAMGSCFSCPDKESIPDNHQSKFKVSVFLVYYIVMILCVCVHVEMCSDDVCRWWMWMMTGTSWEQESWSWQRTSWSCARANVMLSSGLTCACGAMATTPISSRLRAAVAARPVKVKAKPNSRSENVNKKACLVELAMFSRGIYWSSAIWMLPK